MKKKHVKFLKRIVETPSPTGSEVAVADIVRERLQPIADEIHTDTMGSVHATYEGQLHVRASEAPEAGATDASLEGFSAMSPAYEAAFAEPAEDYDFHDPYFDDLEDDSADAAEGEGEGSVTRSGTASSENIDALLPGLPPLTLMLAAHMDEVGLMVTYISDEGYLSIAAIGGVDAAILPGMRVDVHAEGGVLRGVVGRKPIHLIDADERKNVTPLDKLVIDLGMSGKAVKKRVRVGDSITMAVGFERFGQDMAVSRAFDDKVGVFIACRVMEKLAANEDYAGNFVAAITVQEEIGTRGAMTSAHAVMPDVALAFDVTHATDYPGIDKSKYGNIVCGGGPVIARGPNINPVVFERLVKAAEDEGIPYQLEAEPSVTGTDARAIQVTREGIPTGLVSIPLRYMHTPTEVINLNDVSATVKLIARFAADLDEVADFVPGHADDYESDARLESGEVDEDYEYLLDEVLRLSDDVADLQVLAGVDNGGELADPDEAPFERAFDKARAEFTHPDLADAASDVVPVTEYAGAAFIVDEDDEFDDLDDEPADVILSESEESPDDDFDDFDDLEDEATDVILSDSEESPEDEFDELDEEDDSPSVISSEGTEGSEVEKSSSSEEDLFDDFDDEPDNDDLDDEPADVILSESEESLDDDFDDLEDEATDVILNDSEESPDDEFDDFDDESADDDFEDIDKASEIDASSVSLADLKHALHEAEFGEDEPDDEDEFDDEPADNDDEFDDLDDDDSPSVISSEGTEGSEVEKSSADEKPSDDAKPQTSDVILNVSEESSDDDEEDDDDDYDDEPAAYTEDGADVPALRLKLEGSEAKEEARRKEEERERKEAEVFEALRSMPIVTVSPADLGADD